MATKSRKIRRIEVCSRVQARSARQCRLAHAAVGRRIGDLPEGPGRGACRNGPRRGLRLLSGVDGAPVLQVRAGLDKLAAQISRTVLWADCLSGCVEAGASAFLECSPGRALTNIHG